MKDSVLKTATPESVGIPSKVIADYISYLSERGVNIEDISQTIMGEYFAMIMIADISAIEIDFAKFSDALATLGKESGLEICCMHEDIFDAMHKI